MSEGRVWLMLEILGLLSLTAVLFAWLGWWTRSKFVQDTLSRQAALDLGKAKERIRRLETEVSDKDCALSRCRAECEDLRQGTPPQDNAEVEDLHKTLSVERRRLVEMEAELRNVRALIVEKDKQLADAATHATPTAELESAQAATVAAEKERDQLRQELAGARQQIATLESDLQARAVVPPPPPAAQSVSEPDGLQEVKNSLAAAEAQNAHLKKELDLALGEVRRLKADHAATPTALAQQELLALGLTPTTQETDHSAAELALLKKNLEASVPFRSGERAPDDLTRIKGVAKVLNARLNAFGIFSYQQIAEWSQGDVETFGRLMGFKDRVKREDWQGQCRKFLAEAK